MLSFRFGVTLIGGLWMSALESDAFPIDGVELTGLPSKVQGTSEQLRPSTPVFQFGASGTQDQAIKTVLKSQRSKKIQRRPSQRLIPDPIHQLEPTQLTSGVMSIDLSPSKLLDNHDKVASELKDIILQDSAEEAETPKLKPIEIKEETQNQNQNEIKIGSEILPVFNHHADQTDLNEMVDPVGDYVGKVMEKAFRLKPETDQVQYQELAVKNLIGLVGSLEKPEPGFWKKHLQRTLLQSIKGEDEYINEHESIQPTAKVWEENIKGLIRQLDLQNPGDGSVDETVRWLQKTLENITADGHLMLILHQATHGTPEPIEYQPQLTAAIQKLIETTDFKQKSQSAKQNADSVETVVDRIAVALSLSTPTTHARQEELESAILKSYTDSQRAQTLTDFESLKSTPDHQLGAEAEPALVPTAL